MGIIYKFTFPSGKVYIGATNQNIAQRKGQHLSNSRRKKSPSYESKLSRAIRKYNEEFVIEILEKDIPQNKLEGKEQYYVNKYNSYKNGYNSTPGGQGMLGKTHCGLTKERLRIINLGRTHSRETKKKMSLARTGLKRTEEQKENSRRARLEWLSRNESPPVSEETRKKLSEANKGRKFTKEWRQKISNSLTGLKRSEEHCKKISEAAKLRNVETLGSSTVTWDEIKEIRKQYVEDDLTVTEICKNFHLSNAQISAIVNNKSWYDKLYNPPPKKKLLERRGHTEESKQKMKESHKGIQSGENSPRAKLTWEQVRRIRSLYKTGNYTQLELGKMYSVTRGTIAAIVRNRIWKEDKTNSDFH